MVSKGLKNLTILVVIFLIGMGILMSNRLPKCEHIYVATEKPYTEFNQYEVDQELGRPMSGEVLGQELVCIKCYNTIRQIINYKGLSNYITPIDIDSVINWNTLDLIVPRSSKDTVKWKTLVIRGDTLK